MAIAEKANTAAQKAARRHHLAVFTDGQPCPRCGLPMYRWQDLDLGHVVARVIGGTLSDGARLEHRRCNRQAGGRLLGRLRRAGPPRRPTSPPTVTTPVPLTRQW
jgi:hypothetical protein